MPVKIPLFSSVLFLSLPQSEGWPHHGRTFSIYLYPLSFWLTLPQRPRLDVVYPGRAWSSSPACTWHCSLNYFFLQAIPFALCSEKGDGMQKLRIVKERLTEKMPQCHWQSMSWTCQKRSTKKRWMQMQMSVGSHRRSSSTLLSTSLTSCSSFVTTDTESLWHTGNAVDDGTVNLIYTHSLSEMTTQESLQGKTDGDKNEEQQVCQQACETQMPPYGLKQCHRPQLRLAHGATLGFHALRLCINIGVVSSHSFQN